MYNKKATISEREMLMFHRLKQTIAAHPVALALIFFLFYFAGFFGLEQLINQPKYIIYCGLDSLIPFNEWFIFAYGAWFALIPWALITLLIRDRSSYFYLCAVMFSGMAISLLLYLLFPNGVQLRPETIAGDNIAASLMQMVWAVDTSTNVCPSIHVSTTVAIFLAVRRSRIWQRRSLVVGGCGVLAALICLSTVFLKQHSVIDVLCGIALTLVLHLVVSRLMASSQLTLQSGQAERVSISRG